MSIYRGLALSWKVGTAVIPFFSKRQLKKISPPLCPKLANSEKYKNIYGSLIPTHKG